MTFSSRLLAWLKSEPYTDALKLPIRARVDHGERGAELERRLGEARRKLIQDLPETFKPVRAADELPIG